MRRVLPHPAMTVAIAVVWMLLAQSFAPGPLLLGLLLGVGLGLLWDRLRPPRLQVRNWRRLLALVGRVAVDVTRSNLAVTRLILRGRRGGMTSGFVRVPLQLRNPYALAALACIVTAAPGTIWVRYSHAEGALLIHVLDLDDEREWIADFTARYEKPLLEIFE